MAVQHLRLGTRRSPLALAQSRWVAERLEEARPGLRVELVPMATRGDRLRGDLGRFGGKGLFTEELERRLLEGTLDLAVHSLKDLPVRLPEGLTVAAYPPRADPRDVLVSDAGGDLAGLAPGTRLLTGALRRRAQILQQRPDLEVVPVRGNVDTRVRKWRRGDGDGVILAAAGLLRLGVSDLPAHPIDPRLVVPAPGQGTLALEVKSGSPALEICRALDDTDTAQASVAERRVVAAFGGDCTLPLGAWARSEDGAVRLTAVLGTPDGRRLVRGDARGPDARAAADACLEEMRRGGAEEVLEAIAG